jgi:hypothetical protein
VTRVTTLLIAGATGVWALADAAAPPTPLGMLITIGTAVGIIVSVMGVGMRIGAKMERVAKTNESQTAKLTEVQETNEAQLTRIAALESKLAKLEQKLERS